jgi:hypothetical protein
MAELSTVNCRRASCCIISKTMVYLSVSTQLNKSSYFCHCFYSIIQCSYYRYGDRTTTCFDLILSSSGNMNLK